LALASWRWEMFASRRCALTKAPNASAMSLDLSMVASPTHPHRAVAMCTKHAMPGAIRQSGVAEHPVHGDQHGHPARVDPGCPVAPGVVLLGVGDLGAVPADPHRALQARPTPPVHLADRSPGRPPVGGGPLGVAHLG